MSSVGYSVRAMASAAPARSMEASSLVGSTSEAKPFSAVRYKSAAGISLGDSMKRRSSAIRGDALLPKHISCDEEQVGGALGQSPHEVRIPLCAERDVHPKTVAFAYQLLLQVAAYAMQHLELIRRGRNVFSAGELLHLLDDLLIV